MDTVSYSNSLSEFIFTIKAQCIEIGFGIKFGKTDNSTIGTNTVEELELIIHTGKGGTGKTVTSCSTAIKLAEKKYKPLVVSSDPAHTLSDAFKLSNCDKHNNIEPTQMREILPNLHALQVDPIIEIKEQYSDISQVKVPFTREKRTLISVTFWLRSDK